MSKDPIGGIELNKTRNAENATVISTEIGRVTVRLIRTQRTDEGALGVPRTQLGMASEKREPTMRQNTSLGWIRFQRAVSPQ